MFSPLARCRPCGMNLPLLVLFPALVVVPASLWAQKKHAAEEKGVAALRSDVPTSITFFNLSRQPIKVYRLNEAGQRVFVRTLATSERQTEATFLTHPWLLTDAQDNALRLYFPDADTRLVTYAVANADRARSTRDIFNSFHFLLLESADVQRELSLRDDQRTKVLQLWEAATRQARELMAVSRYNLAIPLRELCRQSEQAVEDLLQEPQRKRFRQLLLQQQETALLQSQALLDALQPTPEQREKLRALQTRTSEQLRSLSRTSDNATQAQADLRLAMLKEAAEMLTDRQRAVWQERVGEPFAGSLPGMWLPPTYWTTSGSTLPTTERRRFFGLHFNDLLYLTRHPGIQAELKLTPEQIQQANEAYEPLRRVPHLESDGSTRYQTYSQAIADALAKILTPEQRTRFRQLMLQALVANERRGNSFRLQTVAGYTVTGYPGVAQELQLTDEQKERLINGTATALVLTTDQSAQLTKLLGPPFAGDLSLPPPQRRGGPAP